MSVFPDFAPPPAFVQQPMAQPPAFVQQPRPQPPAFPQQPVSQPPAWVPQGPAPTALARGPGQPRAIYRGQMPEQPVEAPPPPPPAPRRMPSPEELGLGVAWVPQAAESFDWNAALEQVRRLGATGFNLSRLPEGSYQVRLLMPAGQAGTVQPIDATAASDTAAVRLALQRAEQWAARR